MDPEIAAGQLWVNTKICELSEGKEPVAQAFEWEDPEKRSANDFSEGTIGLAIWMGNERKVIRFLETELADVEGDPELQKSLRRRLEMGMTNPEAKTPNGR
jgi:hypothetical protein